MTALNSIRIIPRDSEFLNRKLGSRGEIFFDQASSTLRLYDGITTGGIPLLRADLSNAEAVIGAALGDSPPTGTTVQAGTIWFNTSNGRLYIYYNDGTSTQWVQPTTPSYGSGGGGATTINELSDVTITSPSAGQVLKYDGTTWINGTDNTSGGGGGGSGTVSTGSTGKLAYYATSGTTIDDLTELAWTANTSTLNLTGVISVSGQKNKIRFHWDTLADLTSQVPAVDWHGMVAHAHDTGKLYYAHAGAWTQLANQSDLNGFITDIQAGDNITVTNTSGVFTIDAVVGGGGGGITLEQAQDGAATLFENGTHVGITVTYIDASNALNLAVDSNVVALLTSTQTLTNKTISGASNTLTNISNASLTNSSITINGTAVSLGGSITVSGGGATTLDGLTDVVITSPSLNQVLKYNGSQWVNDTDATSGGGGSSNSFETIAVAGQSSVVADSATDTLTLVAGTGITITTVAGTDTITIAASGGAGGNNFETIAVAGQSDIVADSSSDTLTLAAGTGISITTDAGTDTVTITSTVAAGATAFTGLSDASSSSLTVDKIYLPAITMLDVTANGTSAYRFDQYGTTDDPTIYAINATTIAFNLSGAGSHPFLIQDNTGTNYNTGLVHVGSDGTVSTGSAAQGKSSGTLYWKIPDSISGNYRYQCASHAGMVGTITVKNFATI